jgi:copper chaperone CopZ
MISWAENSAPKVLINGLLSAIVLLVFYALVSRTNQDLPANFSAANAAELADRVSNTTGPDLRRLDAYIVGISCPVCLIKIQRKLEALPGVTKAAVIMKRPWSASIVYHSKSTNEAQIIKVIKSVEKNTRVLRIQDVPIERAPVVLIPPRSAIPTNKYNKSSN